MKPFRWKITKREQLGRLVDEPGVCPYPKFFEDLRRCAARVVALSGDANLVFVGRSPESIFDYLSGVLFETDWCDRLSLANLSIRFRSPRSIARSNAQALPAAREHFRAIGLSPWEAIRNDRPHALVDLVASGSTLRNMTELLVSWAKEEGADHRAVCKKIRFVGITWRTKTSPNTFRWQQHAPWLADFGSGAVKNVSVPGRLWDYLGNRQAKVGWSNPPERWAEAGITQPPRHESHVAALKLAVMVFDRARTRSERESFARQLQTQSQIRKAWLRDVASKVRP